MNKTELVNAIAEKANLSKVDAKNALDACLEAVAGALEQNEKVALIGFGTFSVAEKGARTGINPGPTESRGFSNNTVIAHIAAKHGSIVRNSPTHHFKR